MFTKTYKHGKEAVTITAGSELDCDRIFGSYKIKYPNGYKEPKFSEIDWWREKKKKIPKNRWIDDCDCPRI